LGQEDKEHHNISNKQGIKSPIPHHQHISSRIPSFQRILVAYDGTEISKRALEYASYISKVANSEIVIINVIEDNSESNKALPLTIKANLVEEIREEQISKIDGQPEVELDESLQKIVKEITATCKDAGITNELTYKIGGKDPADEIINVSKLTHFDLIIMGSRKISSKLGGIGSTTRKVASTVKIPILIVQQQPKYKDEY